MFKIHTSAFALCASLLLAGGLAACGDDDGGAPGNLEVKIYGEEFIEQGIAAENVADGWSIQFEKFLVVVGDIKAGETGKTPALTSAEFRVWDLARASDGTGHSIVTQMVPGGKYDNVSYTFAGKTNATKGNADDGDVIFANTNQFSLFVSGTATLNATTKTFQWGFTGTQVYSRCQSTAVIDGNNSIAEITVHSDHLLFDSLVSEEPTVVFNEIANADKNGDGTITRAELATVNIATLTGYGVGNEPVSNLDQFIEHQTGTLGHISGEAECERE